MDILNVVTEFSPYSFYSKILLAGLLEEEAERMRP